MKKILLGCVAAIALPVLAQAADMSVAPVAAAAPAVNWTGCYVGIHAGSGWGNKDWSDFTGLDTVSYTTSGWLGGAQLGCDLQSGPLVLGAEATWSWTNLDGDGAPAGLPTGSKFHSEIDWLATAGARAGLVADKALIYLSLAAAWADESHKLNLAGPNQELSDTRFGIMLGAGIEYMIAPFLSAKIEYDYIDFAGKDYNFNQLVNQAPVTNEQDVHLVKFGVNYRFGGIGKAPVVARY